MTKVDKKDFTRAVNEIVRMIPYGRATSYGAIAKAIGYPNMSRMVGHLIGGDDGGGAVPAYRVVNSSGVLSGKESFGSSGEMQQLLEAEGITVVNDKIKNWKKVFWNPLDEIEL
ncbi:MGMT family protein [Prevotella sp. 10(H)]|uniref:MGMT family protein n=1 Tax=Prevotella sp. 10(H) TaxID=1158294 RepID=UPI0004A6EA8D|nr:MGMT family protein [Prevotella sp. 10(H)]